MCRFVPNSLLWLGILALALAQNASAQVSVGPRVGPGIPELRLAERNSEKLGLDEKGVEAVKKMIEEANAQEEKLSEQMRDARVKMRDLLDQELPGEAALLAQSDAMAKLTAEMQKHQLKASLALRALLTPEQRKTFMELRKAPQPRRRRPR
ncbi:MAG: periplasmic heavy metal sensor [Myxococcales bacterium]|nr:periplasmic heavy metal sensor [Myxococcales bacterium]MDH5305602.1 periplasmic heavy metal sensor [Myxococcales bacterium]MDH5565248.1 periplasmic heavy metal sensor [Myxococcales bacterium]